MRKDSKEVNWLAEGLVGGRAEIGIPVAPKPKFLASTPCLCFMHLSWWSIKCQTHDCYFISQNTEVLKGRWQPEFIEVKSKPRLRDCIHVTQGVSVLGSILCISSLVTHSLTFSFESTSFTVGSSSSLHCQPLALFPSLPYLPVIPHALSAFPLKSLLPASNPSPQANPSSSIITDSIRAFLTLANPKANEPSPCPSACWKI